MFGYIGDLRGKTQGRAVFSMAFDSYGEVPKNVADEIIQKEPRRVIFVVSPVGHGLKPCDPRKIFN